MLCQNRHPRGADFVGGIAIGRDSVAAHKACLNPSVFHYNRRHIVADERHIHARLLELVARKPCTLEKRPRLVRKDVKLDAPLLAEKDWAECRAVPRCCERPRVAVRQYAVAVLNQRKPGFRDLATHFDVFLVDGFGFRLEVLCECFRLCDALFFVCLFCRSQHALYGIAQVNRRRA